MQVTVLLSVLICCKFRVGNVQNIQNQHNINRFWLVTNFCRYLLYLGMVGVTVEVTGTY